MRVPLAGELVAVAAARGEEGVFLYQGDDGHAKYPTHSAIISRFREPSFLPLSWTSKGG